MRSWELKSGTNQPLSVFVRPLLADGHDYIKRNIIRLRFRAAPLLGRAWALQERLLAPRNLHFYASELIWECRSTLSCECTGLDSPLTGPHNTLQVSSVEESSIHQSSLESIQFLKGLFTKVCDKSNSIQESFDFWLHVVQCYSRLSLSKSSDTSVALAGIAQRVQDHIKLEYVAGMWDGDLARGLLWRGTINRSGLIATRRSTSMPTWSWMSRSTRQNPDDMLCTLSYSLVLLNGFLNDERFQIHSYSIKFESDNDGQFSSPKSGQVDITGVCLPATITFKPSLSTHGGIEFGVNLNCDDVIRSELLWADCPYSVVGRGPLLEGEEVCCLLVGTTEKKSNTEQREYVLVLRKAEEQASCYERIGLSLFGLENYSVFRDAPVSKIKII